MALKRIILEMGHGNDMHGGDYAKAALRAVQDALHHSSLPFHRSLGFDVAGLEVEVTVAVQRPEQVDAQVVAKSLPIGKIKVNVVKGGLDVIDKETGAGPVITTAAIAVRGDLETHLAAK
jgi:uncharacterized protein (TIGR02058 family)